MSTSRIKKENVILLPNKDKLHIGKTKEISKFLNMVSAEYGIEEDMGYFNIIKDKSEIVFQLQFIPREVSELHSVNAKKFVLYELVRIGRDCVIKTDDELHKRALVIDDLLNKIDDTCKETITSKLNTMFEIPGELDYLLEQMLTDPQFNSFKYPVQEDKKKSSLLCVNGDGVFIRSMEVPFNVTRQLSWKDIDSIKVKKQKMIFQKSNGETEEVVCGHKKTIISAAHDHLLQYLAFIGNRESCENKKSKGNWFDTFSLKVRQSFRKRSKSQEPDKDMSVSSSLSKSLSRANPKNAPADNAPIVIDDSVGLRRATVETSPGSNNFTHNTSVGSASSFSNCPSSYDHPTSSLIAQAGLDDLMSVKTTSTYEVTLDNGPTQRTISDSSKGDSDSLGPAMVSFGQSQPTKSSPVSQMRMESVISKDQVYIPPLEPVKHSTKIVPVPPPMVPIRTSEIQEPFQPQYQYPQFEVVKLPPPPPPVRSTDIEVHESFLHSSYAMPPQMVPELECLQVIVEEPRGSDLTETIDSLDLEETIVNAEIVNVELMVTSLQDQDNSVMDTSFELPILTDEVTEKILAKEEEHHIVMETEGTILRTTEVLPQETDTIIKDTDKQVKVECKLPVYQRKSIPSPKIQRPSRIPSSPRDPTSPSAISELALKAPSPSDKENYNSSPATKGAHNPELYPSMDNSHGHKIGNINRIDQEQHKSESKIVTQSGDSATKKSTKTEVSPTTKTSGIPPPKQYKTTTPVASTAKKPSEPPKSPIIGAPRASGIPRMSLK